MRHFLATSAVLLIFSTGKVFADSWPQPEYIGSGEKLKPETVSNIVNRLAEDCPLLNEFKLHVVRATYEVSDTFSYGPDYHARQYGWTRLIEIALKLADDTPTPPGLEEKGPVSGDVLLFDVGAGRRPGFIVSKASARFACGLPVTSSDDAFISDPWMSLLQPSKGKQRRP